MSKITLNIKLTPKQKEADAAPARFKVLKWGRRVGKTWFEAYSLAKWALPKPRGKFWYVTKTLSLGREELFPALLNLLPRHCVAKLDERLLSVRLTNGSTISIKSGEKEDNLRGRGLDGLVLDEAAFLRERLWDQVLRPQLAHSKGPAIIASSPKKGWFTRAFNDAATGKFPGWHASHATIYDSTLDPGEIEIIRAKTPESTWRQEYLAEELANAGQVYEEFTKANIYSPAERFLGTANYPCVIGIDYGLDAPTGVAWLCVSPEGYLVVPTIHQRAGWDIPRHAKVINTRSAGYKIFGWVLDCSAFRNEGTSMTSISDLFAKEGIVCQKSEKDFVASVDILKRFVRGDGQTPWLYISSDCPETINDFQDWEHGDHEPDALAAIRYAAVWAVRRKLTKLADAIPVRVLQSDPFAKASDEQLLAFARTRPRKPAPQWSWDMTGGVPY